MNSRYQILLPKWIITVNTLFEVLTDYALVIKDSAIHSLVPVDELQAGEAYPGAEIVDLPNHLLMPGLDRKSTRLNSSH